LQFVIAEKWLEPFQLQIANCKLQIINILYPSSFILHPSSFILPSFFLLLNRGFMTTQNMVVVLLAVICVFTDLRYGKIYNKLTYPAVVLGIALSFFHSHPDPYQSIAGLFGALCFYGLLRKFSGMGAGDVKLMAAVGALKGLPFVIFSSFYIFSFGCLAGLAVLAWKGRLIPGLKWVALTVASVIVPGRERPVLKGEMTSMPFAPSIFLGVTYCLYLEIVNGPFSVFSC
jgi:prepilin peptidase CpaA